MTFAQQFKNVESDAIDFIRKCLVYNPNKRMTIEEALNHKYLSDFKGTESEPVACIYFYNRIQNFCSLQ